MWNSELPIQICKCYDCSQTIKSNEIIKIDKLTRNETEWNSDFKKRENRLEQSIW